MSDGRREVEYFHNLATQIGVIKALQLDIKIIASPHLYKTISPYLNHYSDPSRSMYMGVVVEIDEDLKTGYQIIVEG